MRAVIARTEAVEPAVKAFNSFDEGDALAQAGLGRAPRRGPPARAARRNPDRAQGRDRGRGAAVDGLEPDAGEFRVAVRRDGRAQAQGGGGDLLGPAQPRRVRDGLVDGKLRLRRRPAIRGISRGSPAAPRAAAPRRVAAGEASPPSARTPAARSASPPPCAGSSGSSPPTGWSPASGWSPSPRRSTRSGRSRGRWRTRRSSWGRSPATIRWTRPRSRWRSPTTGPSSPARRALAARHSQGVFRGGARSGGRRRGGGGRRLLPRRGLRDPGGLAAAHEVRDRRLLHHRHGRMLVQPRPLRRDPLRPPREGRRRTRWISISGPAPRASAPR